MSGGLQLLKNRSLGELSSGVKIAIPARTQNGRQKIHIPSRSIPRERDEMLLRRTMSTARSTPAEPSSMLANHLNSTFSPLQFPPELATRLLTHASHPDAQLQGHNGRLAFGGRRVLESYFLLFLQSCPEIRPTDDYEQLASSTLNTYLLGEHVAPKWSLGRVLRWTPVGDIQVSPRNTSVGLHKVMGTTVEAVVGGIYHQFGGSVAHRIFHTRILPHLLLPGTSQGLQDFYHDHAMQVYQRMGGQKDSVHL